MRTPVRPPKFRCCPILQTGWSSKRDGNELPTTCSRDLFLRSCSSYRASWMRARWGTTASSSAPGPSSTTAGGNKPSPTQPVQSFRRQATGRPIQRNCGVGRKALAELSFSATCKLADDEDARPTSRHKPRESRADRKAGNSATIQLSPQGRERSIPSRGATLSDSVDASAQKARNVKSEKRNIMKTLAMI